MMGLEWIIWLIGLVITHCAAYAWGYSNAEESQLDEQARLELEKYSYDKFYEHERWKEERKASHE